MIKVLIKEKSITLKGHANFADYGKDIVCASCSSIIATSVNDMMTISKESISYKDDGKEMVVEILDDNQLVIKLFNNLKELLVSLSDDYPKNIKIESEE